MTIANYISVCLDKYTAKGSLSRNQKVKIIEVGAGNGSAAESMLDYFRSFHPLKYKNMEYTIVEISPVMTARCRKNLSVKHAKKIQQNEIRFENVSISKFSRRDNDLTFVVMLEVLDNMPHDRVYFVSIMWHCWFLEWTSTYANGGWVHWGWILHRRITKRNVWSSDLQSVRHLQ